MDLILLYDTETNGIPQWNLPSEEPSQPHITQLAAELCDERSGNTIETMGVLIRPDGWTIPHEGIPLADALRQFTAMWRRAAMRVAHNESFDARMMRIEYFRELDADDPFHDEWKAGPAFCTQGRSTKIINLPPTAKMLAAGRKHAKSQNLGEAYKFFTGSELDGAHDASVDVGGCKAVYYGIKRHAAKAA
jgi:DNA polymerase-3 subunit epsilon